MKLSCKQFLAMLGGIGSVPLFGFGYMKLFEADWYEVTNKPVTNDQICNLKNIPKFNHLLAFSRAERHEHQNVECTFSQSTCR